MEIDMDSLTSKSSIVQSVVVAYELLNFLANKGRPQRVTDIAKHLDMTKARVSRHLSTLASLQLVVKTPDNRGYRLGSKLFSLSNAAMDQYEITNITDRYLMLLKNKISKPLFLSVPAGGDAVVASTVTLAGQEIYPEILRGHRYTVPVSPTARLTLAFSSSAIRERVISRRTEKELSSEFEPNQFSLNLKKIQKNFYEYDGDAYHAGFSALVIPIFNHIEVLEAAITILWEKKSCDTKEYNNIFQSAMESAITISSVLGSKIMVKNMQQACE